MFKTCLNGHGFLKVKVKATQGQVHSKKLSISNKYVRDLVDQRFHLVAPIFAKNSHKLHNFFSNLYRVLFISDNLLDLTG